ncbi:MAG: cell division protein ZapB [Bryobacteraceae bacterium]
MQSEVEVDALVELEERIRRTVELVASLRLERDAALEELAAARKSADEGGTKLKAEMDTLQAERKQVRTRIEKLLGQMDQLGS